jgi:hypothetical protein
VALAVPLAVAVEKAVEAEAENTVTFTKGTELCRVCSFGFGVLTCLYSYKVRFDCLY